LAFVHDDDFESTVLSTVVAAIRRLVLAEKPIGPQMVMDELRRMGELTREVAVQLQAATTSGADSGVPVPHYAAAVVADSLRRRVESAGVALTAAADGMAEADLAPLVHRAAVSVRDCANRLATLRGEQS
jgi:replicative DNA helicase